MAITTTIPSAVRRHKLRIARNAARGAHAVGGSIVGVILSFFFFSWANLPVVNV
jgi:hypothetical protein